MGLCGDLNGLIHIFIVFELFLTVKIGLAQPVLEKVVVVLIRYNIVTVIIITEKLFGAQD